MSPTELAEMCRKAGVKATSQRIEILRLLLSSTRHPDARSVYENAKKRFPTISLNTVYQNLGIFEKAGLITRVSASGDRMLFEADNTPHHHFICNNCDEVFDFENNALDAIRPPTEALKLGKAESVRVVIRGICNACQAERSTSQ
ncbi:MAG: transcriptional repressor [Lentisphaerae bacterium]|jgi:Fur family peroxide stress response transcriptional regulator|nr:transcriptional repressor [Lentisphaerota bacterium]